MKKTAVLCTGDELLDGRVQDKNALYIARRFAASARSLEEVRFVADERDHIAEALRDLSGFDEIIVSGGLGPTADDITRDAAADFSNTILREDRALLEELRERFARRGYRFTENNRRQCMFPENATILPTQVGTAAGFQIETEETTIYFFPGVPSEFRWFVKRYLPEITADDLPARKRLILFGLGESDVETRLAGAVNEAQRRGVRVGYRAETSLIEVNLKGAVEDLNVVEAEVRKTLGRWLVAEDEEGFTERVARLLVDASETVSVAESCTAGLLGARLTDVPGSSRYFHEGYLTYSNEAKQRLLQVSSKALQQYGAVSPQVVAQMAQGAKIRSGATFALAISGIAGPSGGTDEKPPGTVDFALAATEGVYHCRRYFPERTRHQVRTLSVHTALALLLWRLEARHTEHDIAGPFSASEVNAGIIVA